MNERRSILLLCDDSRGHAGNVLQHIAALTRLSSHDMYPFNPVAHPAACARLDLDEFDAVVIHYTLALTAERYLPAVLREKIARFGGLKLQFIQDEYREVDAVTALMRELGIHVLFTCVPSPEREEIYRPRLPGVTLVTTLPGFVPEELVGREVSPLARRPVDVGYRGRDVPYWLGSLGREKVEIGRRFLEAAEGSGLRCDISSREDDRIYGERWNQFLASCRSTLGTESGASVIDFDGSIRQRVSSHLARHADASFEDVEREILEPYEGRAAIHVASPRLFEAAALRTALILFRGEYSGVVEAGTHYLPLEKDFSNVAEVIEAVRDENLLEVMTTRAYDDLVASRRYSLAALVQELDAIVVERADARAPAAKQRYRQARRRRAIPSWGTLSGARRLGGRLLKPTAAAYAIGRDPAVRRLALAGRLDPRLAGDLWRLAALRRSAGRSFHLASSLEDGGRRLVLTSQAEPPAASGDGSWDGPDSVPSEIVWNHSPVAATIPLLGTSLLDVPMGSGGVAGGYRFERLASLARRDLVLQAFRPLLAKPPRQQERRRDEVPA